MILKILIVVILLLILGSLASGFFYLVRDKGRSKRTVKALSWRIGLSVSLFLLLMLGYATGMIKPHGLVPLPAQAVPAESHWQEPGHPGRDAE